MVKRTFWINRIEEEWGHRTILWLKGVRRAGKTLLTQWLEDVEYFDCALTPDASPPFTRAYHGTKVRFLTVEKLVERISPPG